MDETTAMEVTETKDDIEKDIEVKDDESENKSEVFKKPQLLVGPRRGKAVGKIRSIENKCEEKEPEEQEPVLEEVEKAVQSKSEGRATSKSSFSPAQKIKENSIPLPYIEPKWGGMPKEHYAFEVLKSGKILEKINLNSKSFFVFGRLSTCDIHMTHPTISRYHAILQYRAEAGDNDGVGYYLYDLGSTHGSFVNKSRVKPNVYIRIRVGYIIKLGCSTRLFLLQGPDKDMEEESELTVTELKEKRNRELIAKEAEDLREQQIEEAREQLEAERGIDWGMGEDADEETDLTENPFASTQNEELYIQDPKKTLRGWFEREGYDLEYDVEEKNFGEFLCRVELPIESSRGGSLTAEAVVKGKKKEAVVQCALEACRILDRYGLLRQATHESKKRKAKDWEAEDFYDSDEDTFLDRTGSIEKKRQKRMKAAGKKDPEEVVETYDSLQKKHSEVLIQLQKLEEELKSSLAAIGICKTDDSAQNEEEDALDAFMNTLSEKMPDKKQVAKLKSQISTLKQEEVRLSKLINITKPANLPELPSKKKTDAEASKSKSLPLIGARRKPSSSTQKQKSTPQRMETKEDEAEMEEEEDEEETEQSNPKEKVLVTEKEGTSKDMPMKAENKDETDSSELQEETQVSEGAELNKSATEDESDEPVEANKTNASVSETHPKLIGPTMPSPEEYSLTTEENEKEQKEEKQKQEKEENEKEQKEENEKDQREENEKEQKEENEKEQKEENEKEPKEENEKEPKEDNEKEPKEDNEKEPKEENEKEPKEENEKEQNEKEQKEENQKEQKEQNKKQKSKKKKNKTKVQEDDADYDASDPDYAVWMPPEDQSGDGRTKLNDKYGY